MRGRIGIDPLIRVVAKMGVLGLLLTILPMAGAGPGAAADADLTNAVERAVTAQLGAPPPAGISLSTTGEAAGWVFGGVAVRLAADEHGTPRAFLYLARRGAGGWQVALEPTAAFDGWVREAPPGLIPPAIVAIYGSGGSAGGVEAEAFGGPALALPWAVGETWSYWSGPHDSHVVGVRNALDFSGGTGQIRAAAGGVALTFDCDNLVKITHDADGWQTTYYHVANIAVTNGQQVVRGQFLGNQSQGVGCGGFATGPHQHFGIELNQNPQPIDGSNLGGWRVRAGVNERDGCMVKAGVTQCAPSGTIPNDGTIGARLPRLVLAPTTADQGQAVRVTLTGYKMGERVEIRMSVAGTVRVLRTVTASAEGTGVATFLVPQATTPGRKTVSGVGAAGSRASAFLQVT